MTTKKTKPPAPEKAETTTKEPQAPVLAGVDATKIVAEAKAKTATVARAEGQNDIATVDKAQALPELGKDAAAHPADETIKAFKDADRRTMRVVMSDLGQLFKQEV